MENEIENLPDETKIKEMACLMCKVNCNHKNEPTKECTAYKYAKRAFKAGYKKVMESEINFYPISGGIAGYASCGNCHHIFGLNEPTNYCPKCGYRLNGVKYVYQGI